MNTPCTFALVTVMSLWSYKESVAQDQHWAIEFRPAVNFPTQALGSQVLLAGRGAEATVAYRFLDHWDAYLGWGWNPFIFQGLPDSRCVETGYTFGVKFIQPAGDGINYQIGAGAVYDHLQVENIEGAITEKTGRGLGWQAEAGISFPLNVRWTLTPAYRYRWVATNVRRKEMYVPFDLTYLSASVSIALHF